MADEFFISLTLISTLRMRGESRGILRMPGRAGRFAAKIQGEVETKRLCRFAMFDISSHEFDMSRPSRS
jgi:hypothetical protein